ncbi:uracil phosphoribosyltransferase [Echinicola marina]|uniref:uracil phosphoribosyltransferase n=1 Tax=Echinicola marina TaxID=2859768 RepID=UPI001CF60C0C|nr:uracil phosphoribosyltransferase [Echinicola marina]UCS94079.1 uracil phosphoribosyltransferase [Echinicola marina]
MFILNNYDSIAHQFLEGLRDITVQKDRLKFRSNLERLGQILAYEISKSLNYEQHTIRTPLAETISKKLQSQPVLISILRAAMPFYNGFLNYFDEADSGFIGAYRREDAGDEVSIEFNYLAVPSLEEKEVIIIDPMLATGKSLITTINHLQRHGKPKKFHIAAAIAAPEGIEYINKNLNQPFELWIGALDEKLNDKAYIVPGLGDAGDLSFGPKL